MRPSTLLPFGCGDPSSLSPLNSAKKPSEMSIMSREFVFSGLVLDVSFGALSRGAVRDIRPVPSDEILATLRIRVRVLSFFRLNSTSRPALRKLGARRWRALPNPWGVPGHCRCLSSF